MAKKKTNKSKDEEIRELKKKVKKLEENQKDEDEEKSLEQRMKEYNKKQLEDLRNGKYAKWGLIAAAAVYFASEGIGGGSYGK